MIHVNETQTSRTTHLTSIHLNWETKSIQIKYLSSCRMEIYNESIPKQKQFTNNIHKNERWNGWQANEIHWLAHSKRSHWIDVKAESLKKLFVQILLNVATKHMNRGNPLVHRAIQRNSDKSCANEFGCDEFWWILRMEPGERWTSELLFGELRSPEKANNGKRITGNCTANDAEKRKRYEKNIDWVRWAAKMPWKLAFKRMNRTSIEREDSRIIMNGNGEHLRNECRMRMEQRHRRYRRRWREWSTAKKLLIKWWSVVIYYIEDENRINKNYAQRKIMKIMWNSNCMRWMWRQSRHRHTQTDTRIPFI